MRIIQKTMTSSMALGEDLLSLFPSKEDTQDNQLPQCLVYSSTWHKTMKVLEVVDRARGTPGGLLDPKTSTVRRFHACTGEFDKADTIRDFASKKARLISCTMALGMGQNWPHVQTVIHIGRDDPLLICQMIGHVGRDGRPCLAILLVKPSCHNGKNHLSKFLDGKAWLDDDQMDALALTPVCLRIAFSLDNWYALFLTPD
jgi:hypothetical protein